MYYSIAFSAVIVAGIVSAVGGAVYLAWNMAWPATIAVLAVSAALSFLACRYIFPKTEQNEALKENNGRIWSLALLPLVVLLAVCFILLWRGQTDAAVNTPWQPVPQLFWIALALAAATGAVVFIKARVGASWLALAGLIGLGVSVAPLLYAIGYGYDPLIHQAAEQHIMDHGAILPKTPYYAGQYALVVITSKLTTLPIHLVDIWLLPILATVGIAGATIFAAKTLGRSSGYFAAGLIAILPMASIVNTTPFNLACLFTLLAAIVGLATEKYPRLKLAVWILAAAALAAHPMAGVPALVLAALIQFKKNYIRIPVAIAGALGVPALFAIIGKGFSFSLARITDLTLPFQLPLTRFHALGDIVYALGTVTAAIIAIGLVANRTYLLAVASTVVSGLIMAVSINFSYLPDYEQGGYASRLFAVALLVAAPAAALAVSKIFERSAKDPWRLFVSIAIVTFFFTGGIYLAFPRSDAYVLSKGWNTSAADIDAVHAIADDAGKEPYIVLASQPVSAAALREFGFFKYFKTAQGDVFAYDIPAGGPLYQYYLKMFYTDPTSEIMREAMTLAGVKRGYFVVSQYWTGADHVIARAKMFSEKWFAASGQDTVFLYKN